MNLVENDKILMKNAEICKTFNDYFVNITDKLDIYSWGEDVYYYLNLTTRISVFINHPSIRLIKNKYQQSFDFKFEFVFTNQVLKHINEIDCNKSSGGDITYKKLLKWLKRNLQYQ